MFTVSLSPHEPVRFEVVAFSRPADPLVRLSGPSADPFRSVARRVSLNTGSGAVIPCHQSAHFGARAARSCLVAHTHRPNA
jgi:Domain of unknown function (DUF1990)